MSTGENPKSVGFRNTGRAEWVLIVEADPVLMATMHSVLLKHGYHVVSCVSPEDALEFCQKEGRVRVLISDLAFEGTGTTGLDLAATVRELCGATAILLSHFDDALLWGLKGFDKCAHLRLPVTAQQLTTAVEQAWNRTQASHA